LSVRYVENLHYSRMLMYPHFTAFNSILTDWWRFYFLRCHGHIHRSPLKRRSK